MAKCRAGRLSSIEDVVARFKQRGLLAVDFDLATGDTTDVDGEDCEDVQRE